MYMDKILNEAHTELKMKCFLNNFLCLVMFGNSVVVFLCTALFASDFIQPSLNVLLLL